MICQATALSSGVTAVILTHNRPGQCVERVRNTAVALKDGQGRIFAVNNGTTAISIPEAVDSIPCRVLDMKQNLGASARNAVLAEGDTPFMLMLDDDCDVSGDIVRAMTRAFHDHPEAGAVSFRIHNEKKEEACLLPTVFHGCAVGFRTEALRRIGGYPSWILYYGEEYDVSFKLYNAGYRILRVNNHGGVRHFRHPDGRKPHRIIRLLIANNVRVFGGSFPRGSVSLSILDVLRRYKAVARKENVMRGFWSGLAQLPLALIASRRNRAPMHPDIFRKALLLEPLERACRRMTRAGIRRVVVCETGKFPSLWLRLLGQHGLQVLAFADMNSCWCKRRIRGVPVIVVNPAVPEELLRLFEQTRPDGFLVGAGALPESEVWQKHLREAGFRDCHPEMNAENSAAPETIDLLDDHEFSTLCP